ncbi:MAG: RagB/SusD family nutrient uptake outer membrane protein, partial [Muribaculaceae bacterium]|nr:RagB/SusD family nutrient uptake outer membrane protein [Muribaculaceae bacterium]
FLNLGRQLEPVMSPRWGQTNSGFRVLRYPVYPSSTGLDWRDADQVEFRLTEVYYTLAECRLREGNSGAAKQLVNDVRQRYYASADLKEIENPGPGFNAFDADWMLSEWGLEFLDEGRRRRTDLRRFDKFTQGQWWFFGRATETDRQMPAQRDRRYEWYPLPQVALMVNPGLVQNPNY